MLNQQSTPEHPRAISNKTGSVQKTLLLPTSLCLYVYRTILLDLPNLPHAQMKYTQIRARYCEYTVANAPKILRMRLNKLPWSHCATWINIRFPPAVCSFLLVPPVSVLFDPWFRTIYFTTCEVMFTPAWQPCLQWQSFNLRLPCSQPATWRPSSVTCLSCCDLSN